MIGAYVFVRLISHLQVHTCKISSWSYETVDGRKLNCNSKLMCGQNSVAVVKNSVKGIPNNIESNLTCKSTKIHHSIAVGEKAALIRNQDCNGNGNGKDANILEASSRSLFMFNVGIWHLFCLA